MSDSGETVTSPTPTSRRVTPREAWQVFVETLESWFGELAPVRLVRRIVRRVGVPMIILGVAIVAFVWVFAELAYNQHHRFASLAYDLGIFDQSIWLMGHGDGFNTVRGLETWGHHGSVGFYLYVPFYWMGAGPNFLNISQVVMLGAGAVPAFLLARDLLRSEWYALIPSLAFLTHFSNQWFIQESFHPEVIAITPFLFAYLAMRRKHWVAYAVWLAIAVSFKEDLAFAAAGLGLLLLWRGERKAGWWTIGASAGWFLFVSQILIPAFSIEGDFYGQFYTTLGDTPVEVLWNMLTNPSEVVRRLTEADLIGYVRHLSAPYAFTWVLAPFTVLIALPQILFNLLTQQSFTWSIKLHYAAVPVVGFTVASIEGLARIRKPAFLRFALGASAALALTTAVALGTSPLSQDYEAGIWRLQENAKQEILERAIAIPGPDDSVSATYNLVPYLTHRSHIYMFPNPFRTSYWGVKDENPHDPATVEWLVIDRPLLGAEDLATLDAALATGEWEIVFEEQAILVIHRIGGG